MLLHTPGGGTPWLNLAALFGETVSLMNASRLTTALMVLALSAAPAAAKGGPSPAETEEGQPAPETSAPFVPVAPEPDSAAGEAPSFGEEIVVTGTRIPRKDLTTPAPVTVVSRAAIEASGHTSLGDLLQTLPEQGNAYNTALNNGGDGSTRLSLRSLGAQRTLVLLDGRRMVPGGLGADASVDLDSIPLGAVERVEILKDGASAVYGSDAIAGVVNIITRRRFEGAEVSASSGVTTHGDGAIHEVGALLGTASERGSLLFSAGWRDQRPVWAGDRAFSRVPVAYDQTGENNPFGAAPGEYNVGSSAVPAGTFALDEGAVGQPVPNPANDPRLARYNDLVAAYPGTARFIRDPAAPLGWRPFVPSALAPDGDAYNYFPDNMLVTPQQRLSLFSSGELALGEDARAYFQAAFVNRQSEQVLDPEPLVLGGWGPPISISASSLYNPFGVELTQVERRLQEFGHRRFSQDIDTYRLVAGLAGTLPQSAGPLRHWSWDTSLTLGRTSGTQLSRGSLLVAPLAAALGPSYLDPELGPRCGAPGAPVEGCVPLDLLGGEGSITPAMRSGLAYTGLTRGTNQLLTLQASATGELLPLFANEPLGLAVGVEHRRLSGSFTPDAVAMAGQSTGNQVSAAAGAYAVNEAYAELSVPIFVGARWAERLEATAAARLFHYDTFGSDWTYKLGARYTPVRDVTLRGTWSTAFRAPSISELYLGQQDSYASVEDPCASASTAPASCGAAAGNGDDRTELRSRIGGNPALRPETARDLTVGLVLEPRWVRNLTVTIDYFRIDVERAITTLGEATILGACYPGDPETAPRYCDHVARDPASQRITGLQNLYANAGREEVSGVDLALRYALPTERLGRFSLAMDAAWLERHDLTLPDGTVVRGRGNYDLSIQGYGGVQGVNPAWKANAALGWGREALSALVGVRFVGSFRECGDPNGDYAGLGLCVFDATYQRQVDAWASWDAQVSYALSTAAGRTTLGVGVRNAFDAAPPRIYNGYYAASDPTAYDYAGRFVYLRLAHAL